VSRARSGRLPNRTPASLVHASGGAAMSVASGAGAPTMLPIVNSPRIPEPARAQPAPSNLGRAVDRDLLREVAGGPGPSILRMQDLLGGHRCLRPRGSDVALGKPPARSTARDSRNDMPRMYGPRSWRRITAGIAVEALGAKLFHVSGGLEVLRRSVPAGGGPADRRPPRSWRCPRPPTTARTRHRRRPQFSRRPSMS
jgi:hypothetical protein